MPKIKIKIVDYIVIGIILIWGLAGFWLNLQGVSAAERKYAVIYVQNEQVAELSLSPSDQYTYTIYFGDDNEHTALVEVEDSKIRMLPLGEDLCPKAICSHTGWIEYSYESIVCLPNQIMIVFTDNALADDNENIDGITY